MLGGGAPGQLERCSGQRTVHRSEWCGRDTFPRTWPFLGLPHPSGENLRGKLQIVLVRSTAKSAG